MRKYFDVYYCGCFMGYVWAYSAEDAIRQLADADEAGWLAVEVEPRYA